MLQILLLLLVLGAAVLGVLFVAKIYPVWRAYRAPRELRELEQLASLTRRSARAQLLAQDFEQVHLMDGREFEKFCADLFTSLGYRIQMTGGPGDHGPIF